MHPLSLAGQYFSHIVTNTISFIKRKKGCKSQRIIFCEACSFPKDRLNMKKSIKIKIKNNFTQMKENSYYLKQSNQDCLTKYNIKCSIWVSVIVRWMNVIIFVCVNVHLCFMYVHHWTSTYEMYIILYYNLYKDIKLLPLGSYRL